MESAVARRYILLRSREGNHAGYARLEVRHGRGTVALRMAVPGGKGAVRILLLAGDAETGSVLDLGVSPLDVEGRGQCYRDNLPLPGGFKLYHTLAVVSDWPSPALLLHGPLGARTPPLWQLEDAVTRYLAVPVERPPPGRMRRGPRLPLPRHPRRMLPPAAGNRRFLPRSVPGSRWAPCPCCAGPRDWRSFPGGLLPCLPPRPLTRPAGDLWRFPWPRTLPRHPARWASWPAADGCSGWPMPLPGRAAALPPGGLRDYCWMQGRHGQGYWVRFQTLSPNYAVLPPQQDAYTAPP